MKVLQVQLAYATFGIVINKDDIIINAAPIGKWMIGKKLSFIESWIRKRKGKVEEL